MGLVCSLKLLFIFVDMENNTQSLEGFVRVSTFAKEKNKSVTWIYKMIENKEVDLLEVDGVKFVKEKKQ